MYTYSKIARILKNDNHLMDSIVEYLLTSFWGFIRQYNHVNNGEEKKKRL